MSEDPDDREKLRLRLAEATDDELVAIAESPATGPLMREVAREGIERRGLIVPRADEGERPAGRAHAFDAPVPERPRGPAGGPMGVVGIVAAILIAFRLVIWLVSR